MANVERVIIMNHLTIKQLPYGKTVRKWLKDRYGVEEANRIWQIFWQKAGIRKGSRLTSCWQVSKGDERLYGDLPGLRFERTGTIGKGADRCDFYMKKVWARRMVTLSEALLSLWKKESCFCSILQILPFLHITGSWSRLPICVLNIHWATCFPAWTMLDSIYTRPRIFCVNKQESLSMPFLSWKSLSGGLSLLNM